MFVKIITNSKSSQNLEKHHEKGNDQLAYKKLLGFKLNNLEKFIAKLYSEGIEFTIPFSIRTKNFSGNICS